MKSLRAIIVKDIAVESRNKESVSSMFMFGVLTMVVFNYTFDPTGFDRSLISPGILWVAFTFAGVIGLNRSFGMEMDNDCLQGLLLAPLSRGDLYLGKVASNFIFMMAAELMVMPAFVILNNVRFNLQIVEIIGVAVIATIGFVSVGTILSMISAQTRMREVMLAILQIPLSVPIILMAVSSTGIIMNQETDGLAGLSSRLSILGAFSIVYLTASYLVIDYVVEE
jgi:heme exporter protein B